MSKLCLKQTKEIFLKLDPNMTSELFDELIGQAGIKTQEDLDRYNENGFSEEQSKILYDNFAEKHDIREAIDKSKKELYNRLDELKAKKQLKEKLEKEVEELNQLLGGNE